MKRSHLYAAPLILALLMAGLRLFAQGEQATTAKPAEFKTTFLPEKYLPSDTFAYAVVPHYEASKARFFETAVYKIWAEPKVQAFVQPILEFISEDYRGTKEAFTEQTGLSFDELYAALSGQLAAALIDVYSGETKDPTPRDASRQGGGSDQMEFALFLTPVDPTRLRRLVEQFTAGLTKNPDPLMVRAVREGNVTVTEVFDPAQPESFALTYAWLGDTLVLTFGPRKKTMKRVLDRWTGRVPDSLATNINFSACLKRLGMPSTDLFVYVGVRDILRRYEAEFSPTTRSALEAGGAYCIEGVGFALNFRGPAFHETLYLYTGPEKRGFVAALSPEPLDEKLLDLAPAEATSCVITRFNPTLLWQTIDRFAQSLGEAKYGTFRAAINAANDSVEMDIEKEIIPVFGDYAVLYSRPTPLAAAMFGLLDWVAMVGVKDSTKAEVIGQLVQIKTADLYQKEGLPDMEKTPPLRWRSFKHPKTTINYVDFPEIPIAGLTPCYAVLDDKALISLSLPALQAALSRLEAPGPSIRTRPDFAALWAQVPKGAGLVGYQDLKAVFPVLHAAWGALHWGGIPPAEVFTKHLFGNITVVRSEPDGLSMESHGVLNLTGGVGVGVLAWIAAPNLLRFRMAANEAATIGTLKVVAAQQAIFRQQAEVDQDGNGTGEYGLLAELAGEIALRPHTLRRVNPAYISQQFRTGGANGAGRATKNGYHYRIFLPASPTAAGDDKSLGGTAQKGGPAADPTAIRIQEQRFLLYAWPVVARSMGFRAFVVTEAGEVYASKMEAREYSGDEGPVPDAALPAGRTLPNFWADGNIGGALCNDGNAWMPIHGAPAPARPRPPAPHLR